MEENNNQEITNAEETTVQEETVIQETTSQESEVQIIDGFSNATLNENTEVPTQPEFITADMVGGTPLDQVEGTPLPPKKKVNKTLVIVLIFVVIFGGVMLLMNVGNKGKNNNNNNQEQKEEQIKVNTGTDWGDKYLTYMMTYKKELKTYEVSFINIDDTPEPEMFVKYIDNSDKESMKIFFIADDGFVYETKYYRDYRIRYIYSLKDKTIDWYLYLTTTKNYGSYTMISKIVDNMAFDADIKATNDALLIEYGKRYYDTDYQPVFYTIKELTMEDDFKEFVSKYDGYNKKVEETKEQILDKYKDYEFKEEVKEEKDSIGIAGKIYKYGSYYTIVPADPDQGTEECIQVITLYEDGKISVNGVLYEYVVNYDDSQLLLDDNITIKLLPGKFSYLGREYTHFSTN